jgi:spore cortex formation protein SpoVR/YcgB (stage V sporulation)
VNDTLRSYWKKDLAGLEYVMGVFDYHLNNLEDYNRKVFDKFDTIFELLIERKIKIYYLFIENSEFSDDLLKHGFNIKFPTGFCKWLYEMGYHKEQETHYTIGVQGDIYNHIVNMYPDIVVKKLI